MPPVGPFVLLTALACVAAVVVAIYQYTRYFRWQTSAAGPFVVAALWLLLARHTITVIYQLDLNNRFLFDEVLIGVWNLSAFWLEVWLILTLLDWRKSGGDPDDDADR